MEFPFCLCFSFGFTSFLNIKKKPYKILPVASVFDIKARKVFAYFASGGTQSIPPMIGNYFDLLVFVDRCLGEKIPKWMKDNEKVLLLNEDAFQAVTMLEELGIKVDVFLNSCDGSEGEAKYDTYPINGSYGMSMVEKILPNSYRHVMNLSYEHISLSRLKKNFKPFGIVSKHRVGDGMEEMDLEVDSLIRQLCANNGHNWALHSHVLKMEHDPLPIVEPVRDQYYPFVYHVTDNIWMHEKYLDRVFIKDNERTACYLMMNRKQNGTRKWRTSSRSHNGTHSSKGFYDTEPLFDLAMQKVWGKRYAIDACGLTEEIIQVVRDAGCERKIGFLNRIPGEGRLYKELMKAAADNGSSILIYNLDKSIFVQ